MIGYVSIGLLGLLALSIPVGIVLFLLGFGIDKNKTMPTGIESASRPNRPIET